MSGSDPLFDAFFRGDLPKKEIPKRVIPVQKRPASLAGRAFRKFCDLFYVVVEILWLVLMLYLGAAVVGLVGGLFGPLPPG